MSTNIKHAKEWAPHATHKGVFMRSYFTRADNDQINNLAIRIVPGGGILPHIHEDASEFFYCISGEGEFLDGDTWVRIQPGDAMMALKGMMHGVRCAGEADFVLFSTFSPPTR